MANSRVSSKKSAGRVYTPGFLVSDILDFAGYAEENAEAIASWSVLEPSCGNGAFLIEATSRLICACRSLGMSSADTADRIIANIHGIELDADECRKARECVSAVAGMSFIDVPPDALDIVCADAVAEIPKRREEGERYDLVVGNPPYVRLRNLPDGGSDVLRSVPYCADGMSDLYLAFYWLGQSILADGGTLAYIAPSAWFSAANGRKMREDLRKRGALRAIASLGHCQPFAGATTYTAIVRIDGAREATGATERVLACDWEWSGESDPFAEILERGKREGEGNRRAGGADGAEHGEEHLRPADAAPNLSSPRFRNVRTLGADEPWIGSESVLCLNGGDALRKVLSFAERSENGGVERCVQVKNGFATNLDAFFIGENGRPDVCGEYGIDVVKASTGARTRAFFPYRRLWEERSADADACAGDGSAGSALMPAAVSLRELSSLPISQRLSENEEALKARSNVPNGAWWGYARTQGIADVAVPKVALNLIYRNAGDIKILEAPAGCGVYGGVYIVGMTTDAIREALSDASYMDYVRALGKRKSGGYWSVGGKDIERYLRWWLATKKR